MNVLSESLLTEHKIIKEIPDKTDEKSCLQRRVKISKSRE